jgi:AcrR family transcriptional regulator
VTRRLGGTDSNTRTLLLDAAERLLLREGYAAVTSRRVADEAGVKAPLVHYYFRTMDDLYLEVYRRRAEAGIERFSAAMEVHPSLRTIWQYGIYRGSPEFTMEFVALANHRKAIRDEIARYAQRFRELHLAAVTAVLNDRGVTSDTCAPLVLLLAMRGLTQVMAIERALGVTAGHEEVLEFVNDWIDEADRGLLSAIAVNDRRIGDNPA